MPELPEVETVMRGLAPAMEGHRVLRVEQRRRDLRKPFPERFVERLEGQKVTALSRRAKYILADLDGGEVLIMHLGMTGRFQIENDRGSQSAAEFYYEGPRDPRHDHAVFHLSNRSIVTFNDARRFGFIDLAGRDSLASHPSLAGLGIEPLGNRLDGDFLMAAATGRKTPLKSMLMDQSVVAGLGNIYASEALFRSGLHPERAAGGLNYDEAGLLAAEIKAVLSEAIAAGGSTLRDFAHADGGRGSFQERFFVYDREGLPCARCGNAIARLVQAGRSTFFCSRCQPGRPRRSSNSRPRRQT